MSEQQREVYPSELELAANLAAAVIAYQLGNSFSTERRKIAKESVGMYWVVLGRELVKDMARMQDAKMRDAMAAVSR